MEPLDKDAVNLTKAIRAVETRGQKDPYTARGASQEFGAYQFTPATWNKSVLKYTGKNVPLEQADRLLQNEVAYKYVKDLKDQGYNVGQIASIWNSGKPDAFQDAQYKGVNKFGVKYDVPQYAKSVAESYHSIKGSGEPTVAPTTASTVGKEKGPSLAPQQSFSDEIQERRQKMQEIARSDQMGVSKGLQQVGQVAGMVGTTGMRVASALIPNFIEKHIAGGVQKGAEKALGTKVGKAAVAGYQEIKKEHPELVANVEALANIGSIIPSGALAGGVAKAEYQMAKKAGSLAKQGVKKGTAGALKATGIATPEKVIAKQAKGFEELVNSGVKTKNLYTKQLGKGNDPLKILSQDSRFVPEVIDGKIVPDKAIMAVQNEITPMAKIVRGVIEAEGAVVDVDQWYKRALANIEDMKLSGSLYDRAKRRIDADFASYRRNYGDKVPLTLIDDVKKAKYADINWNTPNANKVNRAVARASKEIVEDNIKDISIKNLNKELSQLYDAQEMLEELGGRAVKGGRLGGLSGGLTGALLGTTLEASLPGGFIGLYLGKKISDAMQSSHFGNPIMQRIVGEIKRERPELFRQAEQMAQKGLPKLPAPKPGAPDVSNRVPILLPAKTQSTIEKGERGLLKPPGFNRGATPETRAKGSLPNTQGGFISLGKAEPFVNEGELTTKVLSKLEGRTNVSKQFISDLTNSPDLKQAEKDLIRRVLDEMDDTSPALKPLLQEARKYKSAEEFVNGKTKLLHGTRGDFSDFQARPTYFTTNERMAKTFASDGGRVVERYADIKNPKVLSDEMMEQIAYKEGDLSSYKRQGFDAIKNESGTQVVILDPTTLKTKSQLTDIWERANKEGNINVSDFANKVKSELLPLTRVDQSKGGGVKDYENITLPDDLRGPVANYSENIYNSPIKTSAGEVHFPRGTDNYFAHTRIEDLPNSSVMKSRQLGEAVDDEALKASGGTTRRVIEIQSDLFQKGRLEGEMPHKIDYAGFDIDNIKKEGNFYYAEKTDGSGKVYGRTPAEVKKTIEETSNFTKVDQKRIAELSKLEPYRNTWHERIIREEVKQAAKDGKTKLQFPTGETAMKIEGLGENSQWLDPLKETLPEIMVDDLKIGREIRAGAEGDNWIITDILGDGKFKAVPKKYVDMGAKNWKYTIDNSEVADGGNPAWMAFNEKTGQRDFISFTPENKEKALAHLKSKVDDRPIEELAERYGETFDISGKVDTNNPIYKFYEKEVGRYLKNKYGAELTTDPQGVKWWEVKVDPKLKSAPIDAFGKIKGSPLMAGAAGMAGLVGLRKLGGLLGGEEE